MQVAERKPRQYLEILEGYQRHVRLEMAKRHALIESAKDLERGTRDQLRRALKAKYGNDLTTEFRIAPELVGGLRIKIGSDVWDNTIQNRIAASKANCSTPSPTSSQAPAPIFKLSIVHQS
jgi:F-type H+-transporting ATPase subunit delta